VSDRLPPIVLRVWFGGTCAISLEHVAFAQWEDVRNEPIGPEERAEQLKTGKNAEFSWLVVHVIGKDDVINLEEDEGEEFLRCWNAYVAGGDRG
jgi:hypothetical protein